jgi:hypothetical protein
MQRYYANSLAKGLSLDMKLGVEVYLVTEVDAVIDALKEALSGRDVVIERLKGFLADKKTEIAALKEELRLAVLRGDILDKEIEEDMKREAALKGG